MGVGGGGGRLRRRKCFSGGGWGLCRRVACSLVMFFRGMISMAELASWGDMLVVLVMMYDIQILNLMSSMWCVVSRCGRLSSCPFAIVSVPESTLP